MSTTDKSSPRRRIIFTDHAGATRLYGMDRTLNTARRYLAAAYRGRPEAQAVTESVRFES